MELGQVASLLLGAKHLVQKWAGSGNIQFQTHSIQAWDVIKITMLLSSKTDKFLQWLFHIVN